jgi:mannitol 2-dehydrogenase
MTIALTRSITEAAVPLSRATLVDLPLDVSVPTYRPGTLVPSVVHIGVGGFHRAHQAVYFDELARRSERGWGITGVGLRRAAMGDALRPQDCLYTVVEKDARGSSARIIGSVGRFLHGASQPDAVLDALASVDTRLVTLTITGDGYNLRSDGSFRADDPSVHDELACPERPTTVFGFLVEALERRRRAGAGAFTVLSCDNVPANGVATRTMVLGFAQLRDPELARWIEGHVAFPSSMVDRITPETTPEVRREVAETFGVDDRWPVVTETFSQWVIEDRFCNGRPPLETVGVQFVEDVAPYELAKKRLLNGSHCALGYLGHLAGHRTTAEVMSDPVFASFVEAFLDEVSSLLPSAPGLDLRTYKATLLDRLANPRIADDLSRLCRRGSTKMPSYLVPSLADAIAAGRPHGCLTLATAGWLRYLRGTDDAGRPIEVQDARAEQLMGLAQGSGGDPRPLLGLHDLFGDLGDAPSFVEDLHQAMRHLARGARQAVAASRSSEHPPMALVA